MRGRLPVPPMRAGGAALAAAPPGAPAPVRACWRWPPLLRRRLEAPRELPPPRPPPLLRRLPGPFWEASQSSSEEFSSQSDSQQSPPSLGGGSAPLGTPGPAISNSGPAGGGRAGEGGLVGWLGRGRVYEDAAKQQQAQPETHLQAWHACMRLRQPRCACAPPPPPRPRRPRAALPSPRAGPAAEGCAAPAGPSCPVGSGTAAPAPLHAPGRAPRPAPQATPQQTATGRRRSARSRSRRCWCARRARRGGLAARPHPSAALLEGWGGGVGEQQVWRATGAAPTARAPGLCPRLPPASRQHTHAYTPGSAPTDTNATVRRRRSSSARSASSPAARAMA